MSELLPILFYFSLFLQKSFYFYPKHAEAELLIDWAVQWRWDHIPGSRLGEGLYGGPNAGRTPWSDHLSTIKIGSHFGVSMISFKIRAQ